jgi:hypothetical protein
MIQALLIFDKWRGESERTWIFWIVGGVGGHVAQAEAHQECPGSSGRITRCFTMERIT